MVDLVINGGLAITGAETFHFKPADCGDSPIALLVGDGNPAEFLTVKMIGDENATCYGGVESFSWSEDSLIINHDNRTTIIENPKVDDMRWDMPT